MREQSATRTPFQALVCKSHRSTRSVITCRGKASTPNIRPAPVAATNNPEPPSSGAGATQPWDCQPSPDQTPREPPPYIQLWAGSHRGPRKLPVAHKQTDQHHDRADLHSRVAHHREGQRTKKWCTGRNAPFRTAFKAGGGHHRTCLRQARVAGKLPQYADVARTRVRRAGQLAMCGNQHADGHKAWQYTGVLTEGSPPCRRRSDSALRRPTGLGPRVDGRRATACPGTA
jgi:hypothetical protein